MNHTAPDQKLTFRDVCERLRIGSTTLYRWIHTEGFPAGKKLGPRAVRWSESDIREWEKSREGAV